MEKSMRKICIFSAQYLPHMGGVERYTYNLAKKLKENGDQVVVVTANTGDLPAYEEKEEATIYRFPVFDIMDGRYPVLKFNSGFFKFDKKLKNEKFDLILINTRFYPHSVYGTFLAKRQKTRCIMLEHGTSHMTVHSKIGDLVEQIVEHCLTEIDKWNCKEFYGVSEACTDWLKHFHIKAKGVLYNSINLEEIEEIPVQEELRRKYSIPEDATVIAFTGRLLKEKGILQLMDAVVQLREEGNSVYLLIAGDGDEEKAVGEKAQKGIIPLGRLEFREVVNMLKQSDIFCLPSDSEGFSTSVLEAAACRCYIVTTEKGGSKEMIINREYGMIIPVNDVETIKKALKEVIYENEYRRSAVEKTYHRLKENYTWDIVAKKVDDIADGKE